MLHRPFKKRHALESIYVVAQKNLFTPMQDPHEVHALHVPVATVAMVRKWIKSPSIGKLKVAKR